MNSHSETTSPLLSQSPTVAQPSTSKPPPLPRTRPPPPTLSSPPTSHGMNERARSLPVSRGQSVQALQPSAQEWSAMNEQERHAWLKNAEKGARAAGQAFLEFGGEDREDREVVLPPTSRGMFGLQRAKSGR